MKEPFLAKKSLKNFHRNLDLGKGQIQLLLGRNTLTGVFACLTRDVHDQNQCWSPQQGVKDRNLVLFDFANTECEKGLNKVIPSPDKHERFKHQLAKKH